MSGGRNDRLPGDIAEWVVYLKEIGVRELRAPSASTGGGGIEATLQPPDTRRSSAHAARAAKPPGPPAPATAELLSVGEDLLGPAPEDPARRLQEIQRELGECERCKLSRKRTNIVFGVGDPRARLMFIGEGPGADEDAQGEPFVGRAGKKLDEMIVAIGLERRIVYIANIVKCRPPNNRDPEPDEVSTCTPFLIRQIGAIRPAVIVTLGSPATKLLLNTKVGITKLRGNWHEFAGIPVMPTFHPAYLLRAYTPENRRKVWQDLLAARARLDKST